MARIICISKYPPLEGGIAAKTFWLCRALAERGHTLHIITDQKDIDAEYSTSASEIENAVKNIHIHRPQGQVPWHIPNDSHRTLALLNTTLDVIDRHGADVIDTGYLIPYGLVGYLASKVTRLPFLLRHGGSDLNKFVNAGVWRNLITMAFDTAAAVITDSEHVEKLYGLSNRVATIPPYVPNPVFFKPVSGEKNKLTLALIGKANYHWRHKGWHRAIEIMKRLGDGFHYLIVSQGVGFKDFRKYVEDRIDFPIEWRDFVHPLEMPQLLRSISGIFVLEQDLPFPVFSNIALEALYCGVAVITDKEDMVQRFEAHGLHIDIESCNILVIPNSQPDKTAKDISSYFDRYIPREIATAKREFDYTTYIQKNEEMICKKVFTKAD